MRIPNHIGIIPDGNRRWAKAQGFNKQDGYQWGLNPGLEAFRYLKELGVKELTFYGFTQDNTKRPSIQREAFQKACIDAVKLIEKEDANLLVIGNYDSPMFPKELLPYTKRTALGTGNMKVNFLVNYGWQWDLNGGIENAEMTKQKHIVQNIHSADISRIDLIIRWGGRRRLSGFLPVQTIYSDFFIIEEHWPDFNVKHLENALEWYQTQDVTLGG